MTLFLNTKFLLSPCSIVQIYVWLTKDHLLRRIMLPAKDAKTKMLAGKKAK